MHSLIWQLLQLLVANARSLHDPAAIEETNPEYTRGQVNLIMDTVGLAGNDHEDEGEDIYEILTAVLTHKIGEIDALIRIQRIVRESR